MDGVFSEKSLRQMILFSDSFPELSIVSTLSRQLRWSHFNEIIYLKQPLQKEFYPEMCRVERWTARTLREKISSMLYERTALSRKPEELARTELESLREKDCMPPDLVLRDPYVLDSLCLKDSYSEKDLESAILQELESFLLELGTGFSFIARQKRMTVDGDDFYLGLLFFHRDPKRLVAVELKLDKFRPTISGRWLCICAGLINTNANQVRTRRWVSSFAPAKITSASNCWRWDNPVSMWLNTSQNFRRRRY